MLPPSPPQQLEHASARPRNTQRRVEPGWLVRSLQEPRLTSPIAQLAKHKPIAGARPWSLSGGRHVLLGRATGLLPLPISPLL